LLDDAKCYEVLRGLRWPTGVQCPHCESSQISKQERDTTQAARQTYRCGGCGHHFDALAGTIFAALHQSLVAWIGWLYLMGVSLSNRQIAQELEKERPPIFDMIKRGGQAVIRMVERTISKRPFVR